MATHCLNLSVGGYEIYCYAGGQFVQLTDVNYLFFGIKVIQKDTLRVATVPILVKYTAIGEAVLIRSFIPRNMIGIPTDESERAVLAEPIMGDFKVPDIPLAALPLEAPIYAIGIIGDSVNGKKEIYTAIVSGAEAATFKIYLTGDQRDGKHEIRFELPPLIMSNIVDQAWLRFTMQPGYEH